MAATLYITLDLIVFAILGGLFRALVGYANHAKNRKNKEHIIYWLVVAFLSAFIGFTLSLLNCASAGKIDSFIIAYFILDLIDKE